MAIESEALERIPLFEMLSLQQRDIVAEAAHRIWFPANTPILSADHGEGRGWEERVYFIVSGTVKIRVRTSQTRGVVLSICGPGEILGNSNLIQWPPFLDNVTTLEPSECLWVRQDTFHELICNLPELTFGLLVATARRLRALTRRAQMLAFHDVQCRVASQLVGLARAYGKTAPNGGVMIPFRLTQSNLAEMVGASPVSINKAMRAYQKAGHISVDAQRRIHVHNEMVLLQRGHESCVRTPAKSGHTA